MIASGLRGLRYTREVLPIYTLCAESLFKEARLVTKHRVKYTPRFLGQLALRSQRRVQLTGRRILLWASILCR